MSQRKKRGGLRNPPGGRPRGVAPKVQTIFTVSCDEKFLKRLDKYVRRWPDESRSSVVRQAVTHLLEIDGK